ncbi:hypothetical protein [Marinagarivorans algicola]|uniref:hypothetical protein n=1 Tax=Marinagarivorans algicola TaxID=1513270 RepID=UPI0006B5E815|nr:hypothetical protein [Marinagarivorans algicola]
MKLKKMMGGVAIAAILMNTAGCGTFLHPERQGQTGGNIDMKIVALNGIGLFFYLVPGLVAFAIDFHQGTIYLPGGSLGTLNSDNGLRAVKLEGVVNKETIEATIFEQTGLNVDLSADNIQAKSITPEQLRMVSTIALQHNAQSIVTM